MRRLLQIFLFVSVLGFVVSGCRQSEAERGLVAIDTLIARGSYDSALARLRTVDTAALTADERAYHGLLMTHAAYKAYDSAYLDTTWIARARTAYANGGPYDRHIRTLLYSGCVAKDLGDPLTAIRWFKKTELEARLSDYYVKGYALMNMGSIFHNNQERTWSISNYRLAVNEFEKGGQEDLKLFCTNSLGSIYRLDKPDSAFYFLNKARQEAKSSENGEAYYMASGYLTGYYYNAKRYNEALGCAEVTLKNSSDPYVVFETAHIACNAACALKLLDSAEHILSYSPPPMTQKDTVLHMESLSQIALLRGNIQDSKILRKQSDDISEEVYFNSLKEELVNEYHKCEKNTIQKMNEANSNSLLNTILALIVSVAILIWLLWFFFLRNKKANNKINELHEINQNINDQLLNIRKEYDKLQDQLKTTNESNELRVGQALGLRVSLINHLLNVYDRFSDNPETVKKALLQGIREKRIIFQQMSDYADMSASGMITTIKRLYPNISEKDISIIIMTVCGCSYETIALALEYTNTKSVQNRLRIMPKEVMGINVTVQQLITGFKKNGPVFIEQLKRK